MSNQTLLVIEKHAKEDIRVNISAFWRARYMSTSVEF